MISFVTFGYVGMFLAAFLAATILPFSSEIVLVTLLSNGLTPFLLLTFASIGNVLGALLNYLLGFRYGKHLASKWLRISDTSFSKAEHYFARWGKWSLLLCWVPVIGDPITLVAGVLRSNFWFFLLCVAVGKTARYAALVYFLS